MANIIGKTLMELSLEDFQSADIANTMWRFNGVTIVPTGDLHDSGFGCMKYILSDHGKVVDVIGGGSDVLHIGGYGLKRERPSTTLWSIDCLPCGLVRLFTHSLCSRDEFVGSDFLIYEDECKGDLFG